MVVKCYSLRSNDFRKVSLSDYFFRVETENQAALHLYQTEGFQVRNQYNYYQIFVKILHYFVCFPANWLKIEKSKGVKKKLFTGCC